jgi:hypothetical protein
MKTLSVPRTTASEFAIDAIGSRALMANFSAPCRPCDRSSCGQRGSGNPRVRRGETGVWPYVEPSSVSDWARARSAMHAT